MKQSVVGVFVCLVGFFAGQSILFADQFEDIKRRLDDLEQQNQELNIRLGEGEGRVLPFLSRRLHFGGFFESSLTSIWGPDTNFQASANSNLIGFNISAELGSNFRFISQHLVGLSFPLQNPHNHPAPGSPALPSKRKFAGVSFGSVVTQAFAEYYGTDIFQIRIGLGYVPFGKGFQQREPALFLRRGGPQLIRPTGGDGVAVASPLWNGFHLLGHTESGMGLWGYDLYSLTPLSDQSSLGGGSRVWWSSLEDKIIVGLSFQSADVHGDIYQAVGADLELKLGQLGILTEYGYNFREGEDPWSIYAQPYVKLASEKVIIHADIDYLDNTVGKLINVDPYRKWEYGAGINWLPIPAVRLRLLALVNDYVGSTAVVSGQDRDYYTIEFSTGITF